MTIVDTVRGRRPQLQYLRGGTCPHDQHAQLSSFIEFYCDAKAGRVSAISDFILVHTHCNEVAGTNFI